jgi:hypothetical protein
MAGFSGVELKAFRALQRSGAGALKTVQLVMKGGVRCEGGRQYRREAGRNVAKFDNEKLQKILSSSP